MRIAVCDDERDVREYLARKIADYDRNLTVEKYECGDDLIAGGTDADIIFLDIQMPGINGMEAAERLREWGSDAVIIFVSAEEGHVFKAFDVGAFHYLVKPFEKAKFYEVLSRAIRQAEAGGRSAGKAGDEAIGGRFIVVKSGKSHIRVMLSDVSYAEVINRKVTLHTSHGEIEYYGRLTELMGVAGEGFTRPHRAFLVNMGSIVSYDGEFIYLTADRIPIARGRHADFEKDYLRYNARQMRVSADV